MSTFEMYLALPNERKLHEISVDGRETYKSVDEIHSLQLVHAQTQPPEVDQSQDAATKPDDDAPDPRAVLQSLELAKGELDVIRDLINNIKAQTHVAVETVPRAPNQVLLKELYTEAAVKLGRKQAALEDVSSRLRRGAQGLRTQFQREDAFFKDLANLQRFWKVQQNRQSDSAFTVDLCINKDMAELLPRGAGLVEVYRDTQCNLRVQLQGATADEGGTLVGDKKSDLAVVGVGAVEAHALLLERQQRMVSLLLQGLLQKIVPTAGTNPFLTQVAKMSITSTPSGDRTITALQLLVRDFCQSSFWRATMRPAVASSASPQRAVESATSLLKDFTSWQTHMAFRGYVQRHLERQALHLSARLHWAPSWSMATSAFTVELLPGHRVSVIVGENVVELEGGLSPLELRLPVSQQPGLRTIHKAHMLLKVNRTEVPHMLIDLLEGR